MTENWDSYLCSIEGKSASILINLSLAAIAPVPEYPVLAYVSIAIQHPDENGFPTEEEEDTLTSLEDRIIAALTQGGMALCPGHCLTAGRLDIYFYRKNAEGFADQLGEALRPFPAYAWETGVHNDPDWELYSDFLHPDEGALLAMRNRSVLDNLLELGDNLSEARIIEHWTFFSSLQESEGYAAAARKRGYDVEQPAPSADEPEHWPVRLTRFDTPDKMDEESLALFTLAREFGGTYKGWACPAVLP